MATATATQDRTRPGSNRRRAELDAAEADDFLLRLQRASRPEAADYPGDRYGSDPDGGRTFCGAQVGWDRAREGVDRPGGRHPPDRCPVCRAPGSWRLADIAAARRPLRGRRAAGLEDCDGAAGSSCVGCGAGTDGPDLYVLAPRRVFVRGDLATAARGKVCLGCMAGAGWIEARALAELAADDLERAARAHAAATAAGAAGVGLAARKAAAAAGAHADAPRVAPPHLLYLLPPGAFEALGLDAEAGLDCRRLGAAAGDAAGWVVHEAGHPAERRIPPEYGLLVVHDGDLAAGGYRDDPALDCTRLAGAGGKYWAVRERSGATTADEASPPRQTLDDGRWVSARPAAPRDVSLDLCRRAGARPSRADPPPGARA